MDVKQIRLEAFRFLGNYGSDIRTKFSNICGKTGQYDVPSELFQKRTSRKNRCLISWKTVCANRLTLNQLEAFENGITVEFVNDDYFNPSNKNNPLYVSLCNRIGSDENVSAIITIRSEAGSSSSQLQRDSFNKLINNTMVNYKGNNIVLNKNNWKDYAIEKNGTGGTGNDKWKGFLFVSIKGGQQDTIESHKGKELTIFNPACEYANDEICNDIDIVMSYFALNSVSEGKMNSSESITYRRIMNAIENYMKSSTYDNISYQGNLYDYCVNHPSLKMEPGKLIDPIQGREIDILDFNISDKENENCLDFTHDEAVNKGRFYWDKRKNTLLSPARPTNIFWSFHLSNMMQQNSSLFEFFEFEEKLVAKRKERGF